MICISITVYIDTKKVAQTIIKYRKIKVFASVTSYFLFYDVFFPLLYI